MFETIQAPWGLTYMVPAHLAAAERARIAVEFAAIRARADAPSPWAGSIYGGRR